MHGSCRKTLLDPTNGRAAVDRLQCKARLALCEMSCQRASGIPSIIPPECLQRGRQKARLRSVYSEQGIRPVSTAESNAGRFVNHVGLVTDASAQLGN